MDDYLFKANVDRCKNVYEATSYLEILTYSVCTCWLRLEEWTGLGLIEANIEPGVEYYRRTSINVG